MTEKELLKAYKEGLWDFTREEFIDLDLRGTNLSCATFQSATFIATLLTKVNFRGANLNGVNLQRADLRGVNFRDANLSGADLRYANLRGVNLNRADLRCADLRGADLTGADLRGANLDKAILQWASLKDADLTGVTLKGADLRRADLRGANLSGITVSSNTEGYFSVCPSQGAFCGFKKARYNEECAIVKLIIPEDARRSSGTGRTCRCDEAKVISIEDSHGNPVSEATSLYDSSFIYRVGEMVMEPAFCEDRWNKCAEGIHFFITRMEAELYV